MVKKFIKKYEKHFGERREEIEALAKYAIEDLDFHLCPASTKFHGNFEGGLYKHSDAVLQVMLRMKKSMMLKDILDSSIFIVGMFHDVGKCGMTKDSPYYIANPGHPRNKNHAYAMKWRDHFDMPWEEYVCPLNPGETTHDPPYIMNPDVKFYPHELVSLYHVAKFITLDTAEAQAITGHNGLYTKVSHGSAEQVHATYALTLLVHHADVWCSSHWEV